MTEHSPQETRPPDGEELESGTAGRTRTPIPVVDLPLVHQLLILLLALGIVAPLAILGATPSPFSDHANPVLAFSGALLTSVITFTVLHLFIMPMAAIYLVVTVAWFSVADSLGPVGVLMLAALITGVVLQVCSRLRVREDHQITAGLVTLVGAVVALFWLSGQLGGSDALARLASIPGHLVETSFRLIEKGLLKSEVTPREIRVMRESGPMIIWLMPANAALVFSLILYVALRGVRRRLPGTAERLPPFWAFRMSELYIYPVIALCLIDAVAIKAGSDTARLIADNALWVLLHLYWLAGLAVVHCLMLQRGMGRSARIAMWAVVLLLSAGGILFKATLAGLGLLDTWFHFRRIAARRAAG